MDLKSDVFSHILNVLSQYFELLIPELSHVKATSHRSPKEVYFGTLRPSPNPDTLQERNFLAKQRHLSFDCKTMGCMVWVGFFLVCFFGVFFVGLGNEEGFWETWH